jgi:hypothetical protein
MSLLIEVVDHVVVDQDGSENTAEVFDQENTGINFDVYEDIPVETSGDDFPPRVNTFSEIDLEESLKNNIRRIHRLWSGTPQSPEKREEARCFWQKG